ncbi:MAG: hypothetical protein GF368_03025 [Candidatus Aenigmarchaeota archaeon]|nr:hypothetical protein [Candidatus Aenigmarchaeota archaeon]
MGKYGRSVSIGARSTKAQRRAGVAPDYDGSGSGPATNVYRTFLPKFLDRALGGRPSRSGKRRRR